jgi:hypothetical protein
MTVGLPGSGLGGVFYLLSALWMPVHQLIRSVRGDRAPLNAGLLVRQTAIAASMIGVLFATGYALGWLLGVPLAPADVVAAGTTTQAGGDTGVLRTAVLLLTVGALAVLLLVVEFASAFARRRLRRVRPAPVLADPEREQHVA